MVSKTKLRQILRTPKGKVVSVTVQPGFKVGGKFIPTGRKKRVKG